MLENHKEECRTLGTVTGCSHPPWTRMSQGRAVTRTWRECAMWRGCGQKPSPWRRNREPHHPPSLGPCACAGQVNPSGSLTMQPTQVSLPGTEPGGEGWRADLEEQARNVPSQSQRDLDSNPGSTSHQLRDPEQVSEPLSVSVSSSAKMGPRMVPPLTECYEK